MSDKQCPSSVDIEIDLSFARNVTALAQWIERARELAGQLELCAKLDPELEQRLRSNGIAYRNAEWGDVESSGLCDLHIAVERHLMGVINAIVGGGTA